MTKKIFFFLFSWCIFFTLTYSQTSKRSVRKKTTSSIQSKKRSNSSRKKSTTQKSTTKKITKKETTSVSSLRNKRNALQKEIHRKEGILATTAKNVKRQLNDLAIINGKIDKQKKYIGEIQTELDSLTKSIHQLNIEQEKLSAQLEDRKKKFRRSMIYLYKNNNSDNKLLFILSAENFSQMLRRYRYVNEYGKYQQKQGELVQAKQEQLNTVKSELQKSQNNKNQIMVVQKIENDKLTKQQDERQKTVTSLQKKQKEISSVIAANKKEMAALDAKIDYYIKLAIERERKRREAEERARREAQRKAEEEARRKAAAETSASKDKSRKKSSTKDYATSTSKKDIKPIQQWRNNNKDYALSQNFSSNKGRLPMPITGKYIVSAHFGNYRLNGVSNVQLSNKGINITGQPGACARSIFPGEVSAVFSLGGLVNVLVRHGSYISVYCNLSSSSVRQGQHVEARTLLGSIAKDASGHCTLHFQLRKETSTLNPESWLSR